VHSILALCRSLDLRVTAEGVETADQLAILEDHGCEMVQGYLLGRPVSAAQLHAQMATASDQPLTDSSLAIGGDGTEVAGQIRTGR
jgi:EAL domain-containing protein (putative c-di-GMP-specific phosphodiesterase class I)